MRIGFTGTRHGMTAYQKIIFRQFIKDHSGRPVKDKNILEFHHGDCRGADAQAHDIARKFNCRIIVHPPIYNKWRAFCTGDEVKDPRAYLARNRNIVCETDILIAAPGGKQEERRSGTWSTIRYANTGEAKPVIIIYPDGEVERRPGSLHREGIIGGKL